jgi:hypothetical protein
MKSVPGMGIIFHFGLDMSFAAACMALVPPDFWNIYRSLAHNLGTTWLQTHDKTKTGNTLISIFCIGYLAEGFYDVIMSHRLPAFVAFDEVKRSQGERR